MTMFKNKDNTCYPFLDQHSTHGRSVIHSDQLPLRLCKTERADKPERKRAASGRGWEGCLLKAWLSVYYKLKILPCRVCSSRWRNWGGGGVHACVSVAPYPITAGGWKSGRRTVQPCWGVTGGQTGMWFSVCTVLTVCLAKGVHEPQLSAAVTHV